MSTPSGRMPVPASRMSACSAGQADLDARCIAPVLDGVGPGHGYRSPASPHPRLHQAPLSPAGRLPEDGDDAVHFSLRPDQRVCGRLVFAPLAVE